VPPNGGGATATLKASSEGDRLQLAFEHARIELVFVGHSFLDPASVFGHLLLRLSPSSDGRAAGLAQAVAFVGETADFGLVRRIWHGLTGAMKGRFLLQPFHLQRRKYAQFESRDLFAFELKLSSAEKRRLALLLDQRMTGIWAYDFFHGNCARRLLELLDEATGQRHDLAAPYWEVPPLDVLRLLQRASLIDEQPRFSPSSRRQLLSRVRALSVEQRSAYSRAIDMRLPLSSTASMPTSTLEAALLHFEVSQPFTLMGDARQTPLARRYRALLDLRLQQPAGRAVREPLPTGLNPLLAHGRHRLLMRLHLSDLEPSLPSPEVSMRSGMHGLLDRSQGHAPRGAVELFPFALRLDAQRGRFSLSALHLLSVQTLGPEGDGLAPIWGFSLGLGEGPSLPVSDRGLLGLHLRYGLAFSGGRPGRNMLVFAALTGQAGGRLGGAFKRFLVIDPLAASDQAAIDTVLGAEVGLRVLREPSLRGLGHCSVGWWPQGGDLEEACLASLRWSVDPSLELVVDGQLRSRARTKERRLSLGMQLAY
jgi:hypothetical protein